jgi:hypothetical protein
LCAGDDAKIKDANIQLASNAAIYWKVKCFESRANTDR